LHSARGIIVVVKYGNALSSWSCSLILSTLLVSVLSCDLYYRKPLRRQWLYWRSTDCTNNTSESTRLLQRATWAPSHTMSCLKSVSALISHTERSLAGLG